MTRSDASAEVASGAGRRRGLRFPRAARLRTTRDIRRTMRRGRRGGDRFAEVFVLTSTVGRSRIGIVTPRHGRTAVARNRVRRRLSEIARCRLLPALESKRLHVDLIVRAKPAAYETSYRMLQASLTYSLEFVCAR